MAAKLTALPRANPQVHHTPLHCAARLPLPSAQQDARHGAPPAGRAHGPTPQRAPHLLPCVQQRRRIPLQARGAGHAGASRPHQGAGAGSFIHPFIYPFMPYYLLHLLLHLLHSLHSLTHSIHSFNAVRCAYVWGSSPGAFLTRRFWA